MKLNLLKKSSFSGVNGPPPYHCYLAKKETLDYYICIGDSYRRLLSINCSL